MANDLVSIFLKKQKKKQILFHYQTIMLYRPAISNDIGFDNIFVVSQIQSQLQKNDIIIVMSVSVILKIY